MKKLATFLITMLLLTTNVKAASNCTYQEQAELNSKAANIKVSYEVVEETIGTEDFYINSYFKISLTNVSEEFYVVVEDSYKKNKVTYRYNDAVNGVITFNWTYVDEMTNFTVQIYTSSNTNCANEKLKTLYLTTPRYNEYSDRAICLEQPDFYLCQKFVTFAEINDAVFVEKVTEYINGEIDDSGDIQEEPSEETFMDKIFDFINSYKWYIIGGGLVIIITITVIYRIRTKKQRELGL